MMKLLSIPSLLGLTLALTALGCAASAPPQPTSTTAPTSSAVEVESQSPTPPLAESNSPAPASPLGESSPLPPTTATVEAEGRGSSAPVGSQLGERVPDFALDLVDGSTVTSQQLLSQGQPAFLFLFATW